MPSFCKSKNCGARITWAKSVNGNPMPLDFPGEKRVVIDQDGIAHIYDTFVSHFVTCPDAATHRKPRGKS